jgi:hypothetical protein
MSKSRDKGTDVPSEKAHATKPTMGRWALSPPEKREHLFAVIEGDSWFYSPGKEFKATTLLRTVIRAGIPGNQFFSSEKEAFEEMRKIKKNICFTILEVSLLPSQCKKEPVKLKEINILSLRGFGARENKYLSDEEAAKIHAVNKPK